MQPVQQALAAGIPVVAYNADEPQQPGAWPTSARICSSPASRWAQHIVALLPTGDIALFIATPGAANIQPRIDGAQATLKSHPNIKSHVVATGAAVPAELTVIKPRRPVTRAPRACSRSTRGSTQGIAQTIQKHGLKAKGWVGGGYDLTPITEQLLASPATSSSRSTSSPTCRASCRSWSSTCTTPRRA